MTSSQTSRTLLASFVPVFALASALLGGACSGESTQPVGPTGAQPLGPVAHDADEAFPTRPAALAALAPEDLVRACGEATACLPDRAQRSQGDLYGLVGLCVEDLRWSAERAIPVSNVEHTGERAEYYVACVLGHAGDCAAVRACRTERDAAIVCQEDGCKGPADTKVACDGAVATLTIAGTTTQRDCARSFAACAPASTTGCTDRGFTACPADGDHGDRCDGDVRLGCDGAGQVSYRDCARLGGTCGATAGGASGCIYPGEPDPACMSDLPPLPACEGDQLSVCVNGRRVKAQVASFCGG